MSSTPPRSSRGCPSSIQPRQIPIQPPHPVSPSWPIASSARRRSLSGIGAQNFRWRRSPGRWYRHDDRRHASRGSGRLPEADSHGQFSRKIKAALRQVPLHSRLRAHVRSSRTAGSVVRNRSVEGLRAFSPTSVMIYRAGVPGHARYSRGYRHRRPSHAAPRLLVARYRRCACAMSKTLEGQAAVAYLDLTGCWLSIEVA